MQLARTGNFHELPHEVREKIATEYFQKRVPITRTSWYLARVMYGRTPQDNQALSPRHIANVEIRAVRLGNLEVNRHRSPRLIERGESRGLNFDNFNSLRDALTKANDPRMIRVEHVFVRGITWSYRLTVHLEGADQQLREKILDIVRAWVNDQRDMHIVPGTQEYEVQFCVDDDLGKSRVLARNLLKGVPRK